MRLGQDEQHEMDGTQKARVTRGNTEAGKQCEWQIVVIHSACEASICYNMF